MAVLWKLEPWEGAGEGAIPFPQLQTSDSRHGNSTYRGAMLRGNDWLARMATVWGQADAVGHLPNFQLTFASDFLNDLDYCI